MISPDHLRLPRSAARAILRLSGPGRSGRGAPSPRRSGRASRNGRSRKWRRPGSCSWRQRKVFAARNRPRFVPSHKTSTF